MKIMRLLILSVICVVSAAGAIEIRFPEDPSGIEIIDRAYFRGVTELLYLRLFNNGDQGTIELFNGTSDDAGYNWELIYSWQPCMYNGSPFTFGQVSVISIQSNDDSFLITWIDRLYSEYIEGLGSLYLEYNLESGEINELFSD
jgi:hypothetical protein